MDKSKQITEGAILTAIYVVLLLMASFLPLIGTIVLFLLPIPFIIFTYKHGWQPALLMAAAALVLSSIFASVFSIPVTMIAVIGGIMVGSAIYQKRSAYETLARGAAGFAVALVIALLLSQVVFDINFAETIDEQMEMFMNQSDKVIEQLGLEDEAAGQIELIEQQMALLKNLLPFAIVFSAIIYAFINQWVAYKLINRLDKKRYRFPPFRELTFPTAILWIYFVAILLTLFQPDPEGLLFLAVQNIVVLAGMLMFLQGLSLVFYYTHQKNISVALPIIVIILGIFFIPMAFPLLRILGIIDIGFKLRERMSDSKK